MLFAVPWHEVLVVGTTDTLIENPSYEPIPLEQEVNFILETAAQYLTKPTRDDVKQSLPVNVRLRHRKKKVKALKKYLVVTKFSLMQPAV